ncbi:MAG: hypothetical protein ACLFSQ_11050 [Candidatus Zixiibacteriota bacterium]
MRMRLRENDWFWMAAAVFIMAFVLFVVNVAFGQTWKGGNTADYNANDICADRYLLHKPGVTFPDTTLEYCCPDTIFSYSCFATIDYNGDTLRIPVPCEFEGSISIDSASFVASDTVNVQNGNGLWFTSEVTSVCESTLVAIDTTTSPYDSSYCTFCDSVRQVWWWYWEDSSSYDVWQVTYPNTNDTCDIVFSGEIHYHGDVCWDCDTIIQNFDIDTTYNDYYTGFWVYRDNEGTYEFIDYNDTLLLFNDSEISNGVWVRGCDCDTSYGSFLSLADTMKPFLSIDNTWKTYYSGGERTENVDTAISHIIRASQGGANAIQASSEDHIPYMSDVQDKIADLFGSYTIMTNDTGYVSVDSIMYPEYTSNPEGLWSLWTRNINHPYFDTLNNYENSYTEPLDYIVPYENPGIWTSTDFPAALTDWPDGIGASYEHYAKNIRFEKTIDMSDYFSSTELDFFQETMPSWVIIDASDDYMPYISIGGQIFELDTVIGDSYSANVYTIRPTSINYHDPIFIHTGVHSYEDPIVGANMIIALQYPAADSIPECVWNFQDSIILPACSLLVTCSDSSDTAVWYLGQNNYLPDCGSSFSEDTVCYEFAGYWRNGYYYQDTVVCFPVGTMDTIDLSASFVNKTWMPFHIASEDSTDSMTITNTGDSIIVQDDDNDILRIKGFDDVDISGAGLLTDDNITIRNGQKMQLLDNASNDTLKFWVEDDTSFIAGTNNIHINGGASFDSLSSGSGIFLKKWYTAGDSLFVITGTDTFKIGEK